MRKGLTVIEVVVVIVAVLVILGVLLVVRPAFYSRPRNHSQLREAMHLRNIHAAMAVYGTSNKDYFPGLSSTGDYLSKSFEGEYYGAQPNANNAAEEKSGDGCTLSAGTNLALAIILDEAAITPAQMISVGETYTTSTTTSKGIQEVVPDTISGTKVMPAAPGTLPAPGEVRDEHFSFAMLAYGKPNLKEEWKNNQNQQACVLATRLIFNAKSGAFNTVWTDTDSGVYKGSIVRGDTSTANEVFKSGDLATPSNPFATLKYGAAVFTPTTESTTTVGIFGRSTDMKNFDASAATGQIGSMND